MVCERCLARKHAVEAAEVQAWIERQQWSDGDHRRDVVALRWQMACVIDLQYGFGE